MSHHVIHVRPNRTGIWVVQPDDVDAPISEHITETEAERVALDRAATLDDTTVVIHDRYERVRIVGPGAYSAPAWRRRR
jgi:hypothetical protein